MAAVKPTNLLNFDAAYLCSLGQGDPAVEHEFVVYFTPMVRAKLRKFLGSPQLIDEAAQETFVRVLQAVRARNVIHHPERFGAFVQAVCGNVALEVVRRERRFVALDEAACETPAPFRSPLSLAEAGETRESVRKVLASLSDFDRQILQAVFLDEEERPRVCERFHISEAYLRVLVHRAKRRFVEQLNLQRKQKQNVPGRNVTPLRLSSAATAG